MEQFQDYDVIVRTAGESAAVFSTCERYRYVLMRTWNVLPGRQQRYVKFLGVNPSTADHRLNDMTITKAIGFAKQLGFDGLLMLNAFAWRETQPARMKLADDPVGEFNDRIICAIHAKTPGPLIACWGGDGAYRDRDREICALKLPRGTLGDRLQSFGVTQDGHPRHLSRLPYNTPLVRFRVREPEASS